MENIYSSNIWADEWLVKIGENGSPMSNISFNEFQSPFIKETLLFGVALDPETWGTPLQFVNCIIIIFGLLGNIAVVTITVADSEMRSTTNYLVSNLAIADSLVLLTHLPMPITESNAWCKGVHYFLYIGCNASVGAMIALAIDRYLAIVHYSTSGIFRTVKGVNIGAAIMWLLILAYSLPELWMFGTQERGSVKVCLFLMNEGWNSFILSIFLVSVGYFIPLACLSTMYFLIWKYIRDAELEITGMNVLSRRKNKAIPMLIATVVAYAVCYAPIASGYVLYIIGINPFKYIEFVITYSIMITLNSSMNPLIYALLSVSYRKAFKKLFGKMFYGS